MAQYLLSIYQPDGPPPPKEFLDEVMRNVSALRHEMQAAGAWVFAAGLHPPHTATVLRADQADVLMTDGPFGETKEYLGGFWVIDVAGDATVPQQFQDARDRVLIDVKPRHRLADILIRRVTEQVELGLIGPKDGAVRAQNRQAFGRVLHVVAQITLGTLLAFECVA